jgi:hypothetical protein
MAAFLQEVTAKRQYVPIVSEMCRPGWFPELDFPDSISRGKRQLAAMALR